MCKRKTTSDPNIHFCTTPQNYIATNKEEEKQDKSPKDADDQTDQSINIELRIDLCGSAYKCRGGIRVLTFK